MASTVARIPSSARACTSGGRSSAPSAVTDRPRPTSVVKGLRPTKEYRPHRSPPSTDSRRKPVSLPHDEQEGAHRREGVGHELAPHRDDAVRPAQFAKDVAPGAVREGPGGAHPCAGGLPARAARVAGAERPVEARPRPGVARPVPVLVHDQQDGVAVAVVADGPHPLPVPRGLALAPVLAPAAAPEPRPPGLQRPPQCLVVHVAEHEHRSVAGILDDGGDQAVGPETDARRARPR